MNAKFYRVFFLAIATVLPLAIAPTRLNAQQNLVATLVGHSDGVRSVAFSPDGKLLASGGSDNSIRIWDMKSHTEKVALKGHLDSVSSVAFSPDGKLLASGSHDFTIRIWDIETGQVRATLGKNLSSDLPYNIAFSPDGKTLAASGSCGGDLWNISGVTLISHKTATSTWAHCLALSPDGKFLSICDSSDKTACIDLATGKEVFIESESITGTSSCVAVSSDNRTLAVGGRKHTVTLWDFKTGKRLSILKSDAVVEPPQRFSTGIPVDGLVYSVAFSPDGELLAMASYDCAIKLWNVKTGKQLESLKGHEDFSWSVAFSPDGKLMASGSYDHTIKIWNVPARKSR